MRGNFWSRRFFVRSTGASALLAGCGNYDDAVGSGSGSRGDEDDGSGSSSSTWGSETEGADGSGGPSRDTEGPLDPPPNIVLFTCDDLGWKSLPVYGNGQIQTPALDRMAADGVVLTHAFNASSSCSSSRATFATGQHVVTHGVSGLVHRYPRFGLPKGHQTASLLLREAGYRTGIHGKWHITLDPMSDYGYEENLNRDGRRNERFQTADRVIDFITRHRDEPFYLEVNFVNTHLVGNGTFPIEDEYPVDPDAIVPVPGWTMPNWPEVRQMTAGYFSQVLNIDAMMGDILGALEDLGLRESTMSLFVSDNGAPFPGNKKTMFDRGIGTPWIAHWPGTLPAGRTSSALVSTIDLAPTILDGAGLAPMEVMDGESVLPLLAGLTEEGRDEVFAAVDWHVKSVATRGARTDRYKLIRNFGDDPVGLGQLSSFDWAHAVCELPNHPWKQAPIPIGLYDLQEDPDEQANLADDPNYADVLEEMAWRMRAHMEEVGDPNLPSL